MSHAVTTSPPESLYDLDLVLWAGEQARLLRTGRLRQLDLANLIEEVEDLGHSQRDAIESRLTILLAHLLKWKFRPGSRSGSWRGTLLEQRRGVASVIRKSPSLRVHPQDVAADCYRAGRLLAATGTGMGLTLFPETMPFTIDEILDDFFHRREPDLGN